MAQSPCDTLLQWAAERQIRIEYIQSGKPQQNAMSNATIAPCDSWLAQHIFASSRWSSSGRDSLALGLHNERPNVALGGFTPMRNGYGRGHSARYSSTATELLATNY